MGPIKIGQSTPLFYLMNHVSQSLIYFVYFTIIYFYVYARQKHKNNYFYNSFEHLTEDNTPGAIADTMAVSSAGLFKESRYTEYYNHIQCFCFDIDKLPAVTLLECQDILL